MKKILFLCPRIPTERYGGDRLRYYQFIESLFQKHEIYLFSLYQNDEEKQFVNDIKDKCKKIKLFKNSKIKSYFNCINGFFSSKPLQTYYFYNRKLRKEVKEFSKEVDLIFVNTVRMTSYVYDIDKAKCIDLCDSFALNYTRSLPYEKTYWKLLKGLEISRLKNYEKEITKYFDKTIMISKEDANFIDKNDAHIIPNWKEIPPSKKNNTNKVDLAFMGKLNVSHNDYAARCLIDNIIPKIKESGIDVKSNIAGVNPSEELKKKVQKNIDIKGKVNDLDEFLQNSSIFVAPLEHCSGLQNKILVAMANGLPVVTTSIGAEPIGARDKEEVLIANTSKEFAKKSIMLLKNKDLRNKLSENSVNFIRKNYNKTSIQYKIINLVDSLE